MTRTIYGIMAILLGVAGIMTAYGVWLAGRSNCGEGYIPLRSTLQGTICVPGHYTNP